MENLTVSGKNLPNPASKIYASIFTSARRCHLCGCFFLYGEPMTWVNSTQVYPNDDDEAYIPFRSHWHSDCVEGRPVH